MAEYDNVEMLGDDSLFLPDQVVKQKALAQTIRQNPALALPSGGVQAPKPARIAPPQPAVDATGLPTSSDLLRQINDRMGQRPDATEYQQYAKDRNAGANRKLVLALALGAQGGRTLAPFGQQMAGHALKESGDYEIPGGWGTVSQDGKVVWNKAKQDEAELGRLTRLYDITSGEETKRDVARDRAEALKLTRQGITDRAREAADARRGATNTRTEDAMAKHYDAQTKTIREELDATSKVGQLAPSMLGRRPNAIEQQSLMVLLNKFLDPGSVVREGEFDRVARAQGYLDRAANLMQRVARGEPLSDKLIAEIVGMSQFYEKAARSKLNSIGDETYRKANERGLNPANVIIDPYYTPREMRDKPQQQPGGTGRGTADSPLKITPRGAGAAPQRPNVIESNL